MSTVRKLLVSYCENGNTRPRQPTPGTLGTSAGLSFRTTAVLQRSGARRHALADDSIARLLRYCNKPRRAVASRIEPRFGITRGIDALRSRPSRVSLGLRSSRGLCVWRRASPPWPNLRNPRRLVHRLRALFCRLRKYWCHGRLETATLLLRVANYGAWELRTFEAHSSFETLCVRLANVLWIGRCAGTRSGRLHFRAHRLRAGGRCGSASNTCGVIFHTQFAVQPEAFAQVDALLQARVEPLDLIVGVVATSLFARALPSHGIMSAGRSVINDGCRANCCPGDSPFGRLQRRTHFGLHLSRRLCRGGLRYHWQCTALRIC